MFDSDIIKLYESGMSINKLQKLFHKGFLTIKKILNNSELSLRSIEEAKKLSRTRNVFISNGYSVRFGSGTLFEKIIHCFQFSQNEIEA